MQHRDEMVCRKIISEIDIGLSMIKGYSLDSFLQNELVKRAVCMTTINIGELVKTITPETRAKYPDIPWKAAAGMRDIAAHKYQTLRMEDVYHTVTTDFPMLKEMVSGLLKKERQEND